MVLEARDRIGGRVWDDGSLGVTIGRGAQIVNGCVNNPIAVMCEQVKCSLWILLFENFNLYFFKVGLNGLIPFVFYIIFELYLDLDVEIWFDIAVFFQI